MGLITGLIGPRAVHATTEAIERVVLAHLVEQQAALSQSDMDAVKVIEAVICDEQDHHDAAVSHLGDDRGWLDRVIDRVVETSTELVIWFGMKL